MANAPPPETCQLIAMNFYERLAVSRVQSGPIRGTHAVGFDEVSVPGAAGGLHRDYQ
jgi:hypothetical protein